MHEAHLNYWLAVLCVSVRSVYRCGPWWYIWSMFQDYRATLCRQVLLTKLRSLKYEHPVAAQQVWDNCLKMWFCIHFIHIICCSFFLSLMASSSSFSKTESSSAGTWTLNVLWKMCGIDVHMDPNIGKRLNALGNTLTSLTGEEDVDDIADLNSVNMADLSDEDEADTMSPTIHMVSQQWVHARLRFSFGEMYKWYTCFHHS